MVDSKLIRLHPLDNILVLTRTLRAGEMLLLNGFMLQLEQSVGIGHKLAAEDIEPGELIIKYGVPIGSATRQISMGGHVHLHNMKSDYLPTYTIATRFDKDKI